MCVNLILYLQANLIFSIIGLLLQVCTFPERFTAPYCSAKLAKTCQLGKCQELYCTLLELNWVRTGQEELNSRIFQGLSRPNIRKFKD